MSDDRAPSSHEAVEPEDGRSGGRTVGVVLVVACTVAVAGYLTGTARAPRLGGYFGASGDTHASAIAPSQREMATARYAQRIGALHAGVEAMGIPPRDLVADVVVTPAERAASLAARAARRAYDGAPPIVPHAVDERGAPACLACHERGMRVDDRIAPAMSHAPYASCLQCHGGPGERPRGSSLAPSVATANGFVGLEAPAQGERAHPGAPPTIPHRTFMRERCTSCHGAWATGLASTHPWRQSCTQCHAPSSPLDQRARASFAPIGEAPR